MSGVQVVAPEQVADIGAVMKELGSQFNIDDKVIKFFVEDVGITTLRDFGTMFSSAEDVKQTVEMIAGLEPVKRLLQVARVRQAWEGIAQAQQTANDQRRLKGEDPDLDLMLPQGDLDDLTATFWVRYHLQFDSEIMPSDALLSRCSRELSRRMLTVRDVWRVQNLAKELKSEKAPKDSADGFALPQENNVADKPRKTVQRYLDMLWTLMLAYAKAGCKKRIDAPKDNEPFGSRSTDYVQVPLDVVMAYHRRAQSFALQLPPAQALAVLTARDEAERKVWVDRYRQGKDTLGEVIATTCDKREGVWILQPESVPGERGHKVDRSRSPMRGGKQREIAFCARWNAGGCTDGDDCPDGLRHKCNVVKANGQVCGLRNHRAIRCTHREKARIVLAKKKQRR